MIAKIIASAINGNEASISSSAVRTPSWVSVKKISIRFQLGNFSLPFFPIMVIHLFFIIGVVFQPDR